MTIFETMKTILKNIALSALVSTVIISSANAQTDALYIAPSGNVSIGAVGTPGYRLTLGGGSNALGVENKAIFYAKNKTGVYSPFLWPRWDDNRMYMSYGSVGMIIRNEEDKIAIAIDEKRRVGIGVDAPKTALDVKGRIRDSTGYVMPVGSIIAYGGSIAPEGWLLCDGQSCKAYTDLQKVVGDNVPDLRGRFIVGVGKNNTGNLTNYSQKQTGGEEQVTLNVSQMPKHSHDVLANTATKGEGEFASQGRYNIMEGDRTPATYNSLSKDNRNFIATAGESSPHENRPPFYALTYIIKY
ncbi:MAG: phage Tail Collar [Flavipsychrobacter sp.]|nr:phage Tail Collar [Flavipsychrobacter sp.]